MGKNNHSKERRIKIVDPKKIDYTYKGKDELFSTKSTLYSNEKNIYSSQRSKTEKKDIDLIRWGIEEDYKDKY